MKFLLLFLVACGGSEAPAEPAPADNTPAVEVARGPAMREVDVSWVHDNRGDVPVLVDVRTDGEYASGHAPGTLHIPLDQIESRASELAEYKDGDVYLICQSGRRSAAAAEILRDQGFATVNVTGGTGAWIAAGYETE